MTRRFFALQPDRPDGARFVQRVHDLGMLQVPSGRLAACDPITGLEIRTVVDIPPGSYPVRLTEVLDPDGFGPMGHLSVVVHDDVPVAEMRTVTDPDDPSEPAWVVTDSGAVGFVDDHAVVPARPADPGDWEDLILWGDPPAVPSWLNHLEDEQAGPESANVVLPRAIKGENLVMSRSWMGQGDHLLVTTHAADGTLLGVHLDAMVHDRDGVEGA